MIASWAGVALVIQVSTWNISDTIASASQAEITGRASAAGVAGGGTQVNMSVAKCPDKPEPIYDFAKGHSYVCFEGPLGALLKSK